MRLGLRLPQRLGVDLQHDLVEAARPARPDRSAFVGTLDQVLDDVRTAAEGGADELIVDLNLQDWFTSTAQTAVLIRERATAS